MTIPLYLVEKVIGKVVKAAGAQAMPKEQIKEVTHELLKQMGVRKGAECNSMSKEEDHGHEHE